MSDFLTRMAQLSLGAARVVEPRLGSPFAEEARGEAGQSMQAMWEAQPQARSGHPTASGRGMAEPDLAETATQKNTAPGQHPSVLAQPLHPEGAVILGDQGPLTDSPGATGSDQEPRRRPPSNSNAGTAPPGAASEQANPHTLVTADMASAVASIRHAPAGDPGAADATLRNDDLHRLPTVPASAHHSTSAPLVPAGQARQAQSRGPDAQAPEPGPASDRQPEIHINIGRIDVRARTAAVAPAAPAAKTGAKTGTSSRLSLGDYLKRGERAP